MEEQTTAKAITLGDLWGIFVHRLWVILLVAALTIAIIFTFVKLTFVPRYESVATLYILQQRQTDSKVDYDNFNLALKIVNDCSHLIKSHTVLEKVIKDLNLDTTYEDLYRNVKITNPTDTRILQISVESDSPLSAKKIVDKVCSIGTEKITETMGFEQVNFYEKGVLDTKPCNQTSLLVYLVVAFIVAVLTYAIFLLNFLLDDNIRTEEDIKKHLNISILGDIPNFDDTKKKKYGGSYYRRKYYKSKYYGKEYR